MLPGYFGDIGLNKLYHSNDTTSFFSAFSNVPTRKFLITSVADICGLHHTSMEEHSSRWKLHKLLAERGQ